MGLVFDFAVVATKADFLRPSALAPVVGDTGTSRADLADPGLVHEEPKSTCCCSGERILAVFGGSSDPARDFFKIGGGNCLESDGGLVFSGLPEPTYPAEDDRKSRLGLRAVGVFCIGEPVPDPRSVLLNDEPALARGDWVGVVRIKLVPSEMWTNNLARVEPWM